MRVHHLFSRATLNGDLELAARGLSEIARLNLPAVEAKPSAVKDPA
jgi:hypothetical protein